MVIKTLLAGFTASALLVLAVPVSAFAASTVTVTPSNTQGWYPADVRPGGTVTYVPDATTPLPSGALQLTTDATTAAKAQYMHDTSTPLTTVNTLSYATKQVSGPPEADPSYQLAVCLGGMTGTTCNGFTTLVYEPYWNGAVTPGAWQTWDVDSGLLWSSKSYTSGTCAVAGAPGGPPTYNLAALKIACPNATVVSYGVNVGTYNTNYVVRTDAFNFNGIVYNFEAKPYKPTKLEECRNGGWKNFQTPYRSQLDCMVNVIKSYIEDHSHDGGDHSHWGSWKHWDQ
ncbi:MAG: hypothetical protein JWL85_812 [Candidatus Saccharibacteria bacterium]|nr:hypothetical protein [Candidatus Saccharibacteria bacterium]